MSTLIRYAAPTTALGNLLDEMFSDNFFTMADRDISGARWPRVDIAEDKEAYTIKADLPGMAKEDIAVAVDNGVLTLSGEKKTELGERENNRFYHYERSYGKFSRSFNLPEDVIAGEISAAYANGVLTLSLRKSEQAKPKAIEVKVQ